MRIQETQDHRDGSWVVDDEELIDRPYRVAKSVSIEFAFELRKSALVSELRQTGLGCPADSLRGHLWYGKLPQRGNHGLPRDRRRPENNVGVLRCFHPRRQSSNVNRTARALLPDRLPGAEEHRRNGNGQDGDLYRSANEAEARRFHRVPSRRSSKRLWLSIVGTDDARFLANFVNLSWSARAFLVSCSLIFTKLTASARAAL